MIRRKTQTIILAVILAAFFLAIPIYAFTADDSLIRQIREHDFNYSDYANGRRGDTTVVKEDYQINCTLSNYKIPKTGERVWRVLFRVKDISTNKFMQVFSTEPIAWIPFFQNDFSGLNLSVDTNKSTYIEKLYPLDRYEEAMINAFSMIHYCNGRIREIMPGKIVSYSFQEDGIDFRNTGIAIPTPTIRLNTYEMTELWETEKVLNEIMLNYKQIQ